MTKIKLLVSLKIPDTTAITAFHTLERMGYDIKKLEREDYYEFEVLKDEDKFMEDIVKVDVLVNANKHEAKIFQDNIPKDGTMVLVQSKENDAQGLLNTLKERMGFSDISNMKKGILWKMDVEKETAEKITKDLLCNEHYQDFFLL